MTHTHLFIGGPLDGNWEVLVDTPRFYTVPIRIAACAPADMWKEPDPCAPTVLTHTYRRIAINETAYVFYVSTDLQGVDWLTTLIAWYPGMGLKKFDAARKKR